jgi:hypothetical protein
LLIIDNKCWGCLATTGEATAKREYGELKGIQGSVSNIGQKFTVSAIRIVL